MNNIELSVVVPICDEEENIPELYIRLTNVLEKISENEKFSKDSYEIILINDGSRDESWSLIKALHQKDRRLKGIKFSRNFGHHLAITAGLDHARGKTTVLMDGDLQDPPEQLPKLFEKYKEGFDIVYGLRMKRQDPLFKRFNSLLFWWSINIFSEINMPIGQTTLRILRRNVVDVLVSMREHSRFIHGMVAWAGFEVACVEILHGKRKKGKTKYGLVDQIKLTLHALTSFSTKPLIVALMFGFIISLFSFILGVYLVGRYFLYGFPVLGWASLLVSIFFIGGIQIFLIGIIGQYIGRTYNEVQNRPLYISSEKLF